MGEFINKSVSQFVLLKYLAGQRFPGLLLGESRGKSHSGSCVSVFFFFVLSYPCSPLLSSPCWWRCRWAGTPPSHRCRGGCGSTALSGAQSWHTRPARRGVRQMEFQTASSSLSRLEKKGGGLGPFLKEQDVNTCPHLSSLSCHLTFSLSFSRRRPVDL